MARSQNRKEYFQNNGSCKGISIWVVQQLVFEALDTGLSFWSLQVLSPNREKSVNNKTKMETKSATEEQKFLHMDYKRKGDQK